MTTRLGVCGWPVAHSRSPQMHHAALRATGLADWRYLRLPLPPDLFAETLEEHERNVAIYERAREENGGKAPEQNC